MFVYKEKNIFAYVQNKTLVHIEIFIRTQIYFRTYKKIFPYAQKFISVRTKINIHTHYKERVNIYKINLLNIKHLESSSIKVDKI